MISNSSIDELETNWLPETNSDLNGASDVKGPAFERYFPRLVPSLTLRFHFDHGEKGHVKIYDARSKATQGQCQQTGCSNNRLALMATHCNHLELDAVSAPSPSGSRARASGTRRQLASGFDPTGVETSQAHAFDDE